MSLVEIGPRIVLKLIRIFDGSFSGTTLYSEKDYQTPSAVSFNHDFSGVLSTDPYHSRYLGPPRTQEDPGW
jgi:ribosome biogenesis protein BRX1